MKATYSPACIRPRMQKTAPNTTTRRICVPESTSEVLQKRLMILPSFSHRPV